MAAIGSPTLEEFLESKYKTCSVCLEVYDLKVRFPYRLNSCQHALCLECFKQYKKCPECKKEYDVKVIEQDIVRGESIQEMINLWAEKYGPKSQASAPAVSAPIQSNPAPMIPPFPITLSIKSMPDFVIPDITRYFSQISKEMGWDLHSLKEEYAHAPSQWVFLLEEAEFRGFACLMRKNLSTYQIHWSGTITKSNELYSWNMFKLLLQLISTITFQNGDKGNIGVSYFFRAKDEWDQFQKHLHYTMEAGFRFDITSDPNKHKFILTIYPWDVWGIPKKDADPRFTLVNKELIQDKKINALNNLLKGELALSTVIRLSCIGQKDPEQTAALIEREFINSPGNFIIYESNNKALGYLQLEGNCIKRLGMKPECMKFRPHFIQKFWELNKRVWLYKSPLYGQDDLGKDILEVAQFLKFPVNSSVQGSDKVITIGVF